MGKYVLTKEGELYHFGIKGMRWGIRRFQYKDGSLTNAGKKRYSEDSDGSLAKDSKKRNLKNSKNGITDKSDASREADLKRVKNSEKAKKYKEKADVKKSELNDLQTNGIKSKTFKEKYGRLANANDKLFFAAHGKTKKQALDGMIDKNKKQIEVCEKAARDKAAGKLTDSQKMLIGAGAVAVALTAAYLGKKYLKDKYSSSELDRLNKITSKSKISFDDFMKKYMASETRLFDTISEDAYSQLSDVDIKIDKGQVFHRISTSDEQSLTYKVKNMFGMDHTVTKDRLYCAFTEEDVNRYKAILPKYWWKQWGFKNNTGYDVAYKSLTDIKSPSPKARVDIFTDLIKSDSNFRKMVEFCYIYIPGKSGTAEKLSPEELSRSTYSWLSGKLADTSFGLGNAYIEKVKSLGYNAIIDDNDAGRLSDSPIIILDPIKNVIRSGAEILDQDAISKAASNLVEIANRK